MYEVNDDKFTSYLKAVKSAEAIGAEVFEVRQDGSKLRRWSPAPKVSAKLQRRYEEQKNAYAAWQRMNESE